MAAKRRRPRSEELCPPSGALLLLFIGVASNNPWDRVLASRSQPGDLGSLVVDVCVE